MDIETEAGSERGTAIGAAGTEMIETAKARIILETARRRTIETCIALTAITMESGGVTMTGGTRTTSGRSLAGIVMKMTQRNTQARMRGAGTGAASAAVTSAATDEFTCKRVTNVGP